MRRGGVIHSLRVTATDPRVAARKACMEIRNFIKRLEIVTVSLRAVHRPEQGEPEIFEVKDTRTLLAKTKKTSTRKGTK